MDHELKVKDFYTEEEIIERKQNDVFGWFEYVYHYSPEWREDYMQFCEERGMDMKNEMNAKAYVFFRIDLEDEAHKTGDI